MIKTSVQWHSSSDGLLLLWSGRGHVNPAKNGAVIRIIIFWSITGPPTLLYTVWTVSTSVWSVCSSQQYSQLIFTVNNLLQSHVSCVNELIRVEETHRREDSMICGNLSSVNSLMVNYQRTFWHWLLKIFSCWIVIKISSSNGKRIIS